MFLARNRIIAALAEMTVVVEASAESGAMVTARVAGHLGRTVGAVPGQVTSPLAAGPHALLAQGATVVTGPEDVLEAAFGPGAASAVAPSQRPAVEAGAAPLLASLRKGASAHEAVAAAGLGAVEGLAALTSLELAGYVRRGPGGTYTPLP
jgi:DNA processing protein